MQLLFFYELRNSSEIETVDDIKSDLSKKSKKELIGILQKILVAEPRFEKLLSNKPEDIKKAIKKLNVDYDEDIDKLVDDVDSLFDLIIEQKSRLDNLVELFKECFEIYSKYGYDFAEPLEDSMFKIINTISKESKRLPKNKRQKLMQEIVDLTKDYDFFWDGIDDRGIKINY